MQRQYSAPDDEGSLKRQRSSLAEAGLEFLLANPGELLEFMKSSGYGPDSLRKALETPELERAVLAHLAGNEPVLLAMCANLGMNPARFATILTDQGQWNGNS